MATELHLRKLYNSFVPVDQVNLDAMEALTMNAEYKAILTRPRNIKFHRKFFALLSVAFEAWDPKPVFYKGLEIHKNVDRFRKDIEILAGYFETVININGEVRLEAKSISFANMSEDEFSRLYSRCVDVILGKILTNYSADDLDEQVNRVLGFV